MQWKNKAECYYELGEWQTRFQNHIKDINKGTVALEELQVLELIFLLKYYKDVNKSYPNLVSLVNHFEDRYKKNLRSPDSYFYIKTYLYFLNNQFSLLLEKKTPEETAILRLKEKIDTLQIKHNLNNFFCDFKFLEYKLARLNSSLLNREELEIPKESVSEFETIGNLRMSYKEKLKWSYNKHNLLYYLPFDECLVGANNVDIEGIDNFKVYYASSIALPLPREKSEEKFSSLDIKYKELKQTFESVRSLEQEFKTIKGFRNNQLKTFEIIGLFTAVSAFILASVPSFQFVKNFHQAILFFSVIGSTLLLMVSIIFLHTRGFKKANTWIIIAAALLLLFIGFFVLNRSMTIIDESINLVY